MTLPVVGFRKHVMETRASLSPSSRTWTRRSSSTTTRRRSVGEPSHGSAIFQPARRGGGRPASSRSRTSTASTRSTSPINGCSRRSPAALESRSTTHSSSHETRQRNAELALINSVQAAIAGELDPQAIYDLVGDKLQEVFDAQVVDIAIYDEASGLLHFPYMIERGVRFDAAADPADRLPQARDGDARAVDDRGDHAGGARSATATPSCSAGSRPSRRSSSRSSSAAARPGSSRSRTSTARTRSARTTSGS